MESYRARISRGRQMSKPPVRCAKCDGILSRPIFVFDQHGQPIHGSCQAFSFSSPAAPSAPSHWEEEARRYCANADYWRGRAERAEAMLPDPLKREALAAPLDAPQQPLGDLTARSGSEPAVAATPSPSGKR
jgi:hypothetical protein